MEIKSTNIRLFISSYPLFSSFHSVLFTAFNEDEGIEMAWLGQYLSYGKNSTPVDPELKLLRDDRSLRSNLQGAISLSSFQVTHVLTSSCRGYQACPEILIQDVALGFWW
jgi:hypothetical protein